MKGSMKTETPIVWPGPVNPEANTAKIRMRAPSPESRSGRFDAVVSVEVTTERYGADR